MSKQTDRQQKSAIHCPVNMQITMVTLAQRYSSGKGVDAPFRLSGRPFPSTHLILIILNNPANLQKQLQKHHSLLQVGTEAERMEQIRPEVAVPCQDFKCGQKDISMKFISLSKAKVLKLCTMWFSQKPQEGLNKWLMPLLPPLQSQQLGFAYLTCYSIQ